MKTNKKEVREKIKKNILEMVESNEELNENIKALKFKDEDTYKTILRYITGGNFLIYNQDIVNFLNNLNINPNNKIYKIEKSRNLYLPLMAREISDLLR